MSDGLSEEDIEYIEQNYGDELAMLRLWDETGRFFRELGYDLDRIKLKDTDDQS